MTLAEHERKTVLSRAEMADAFARKVRRIYNMSVDEYRDALHDGTLPYRPEGTALEVLSGERSGTK